MNKSLSQLVAKLVEADRAYTYHVQRSLKLETKLSEELVYTSKRKVLKLAGEIMTILPDFEFTLDEVELDRTSVDVWLRDVEVQLKHIRESRITQ